MAAAPRDPPAALLSAYTLQHQVPLERFYVDDASSMAGTTTRFSRDELAGCLLAAERDLQLVTAVEAAESAPGAAAATARGRRRAAQNRGGLARHLVTNALAASGAAAAKGLDVLVFGATYPRLELRPNPDPGLGPKPNPKPKPEPNPHPSPEPHPRPNPYLGLSPSPSPSWSPGATDP